MKKLIGFCLGISIAGSAMAGTLTVTVTQSNGHMGPVMLVPNAAVTAELLSDPDGSRSDLCKGSFHGISNALGQITFDYPEIVGSCSALVVASKGEETGSTRIDSLRKTDKVEVRIQYALQHPILPYSPFLPNPNNH